MSGWLRFNLCFNPITRIDRVVHSWAVDVERVDVDHPIPI